MQVALSGWAFENARGRAALVKTPAGRRWATQGRLGIQGPSPLADSGGTQSGAQFDQILAEKLGRAESPTPTARVHAGYGRHHHPAVLFFTNAARPSHVDFGRVTGAYGPGLRPRATAAPPAAASRPSRTLSDRQQQALTHLVSLRAALYADFTVRELKTAFKMLARLYHPDRHPGSCEFEQTRLSRQFAVLHEAYRQLLNLVPLPPAA